MKERTKGAGQLFILTHNHSFFRLVKNWFNHLPGRNNKDEKKRPQRFYMLVTNIGDNGKTSSILKLDKLLHEYESEYHYLFQLVYTAANSDPATTLSAYYHMTNVARRLLESFLAFRHPKQTGELMKQLENVNFDSVKKTRMLRFFHTHSTFGTHQYNRFSLVTINSNANIEFFSDIHFPADKDFMDTKTLYLHPQKFVG